MIRSALLGAWLGGAVVCAWIPCPSGAVAQSAPSAPLAYDASAWELALERRQPVRPWSRRDLQREIRHRVTLEKARHQMDVYYYRVGYTLSFPLGLNRRPTSAELPVPIPQMNYPWLIWLSWDLEERWRLLHLAWRESGDREAGLQLQRELAALAGWDQFGEADGGIGLLTGHLAASLALALCNPAGWQPEYLASARAAARALIDRDVWPWFQSAWPEQQLTPARLANIPVIALARSAQLARIIGDPYAAALEQRTRQVLDAWCRFRLGPEHHSEGTAYDGYLMDTLTEWLAGLPDGRQVLAECRPAFRSLADSWLRLSVPGRPDLAVPLGDVEPEMTFWATALLRMTDWYDWPDTRWLLRRVPLTRLRAAALVSALDCKSTFTRLSLPSCGPQELPNALSLRTGWEDDSLLAVVGLSRGVMGHLQADSGQVILGWHGRSWITDPGYQQYRPGAEREFTLGVEAHNAPVIGGLAQSQRAGELALLETDAEGRQHVRVKLERCYRGLPPGASVEREVWLTGRHRVMVRDSFAGLTNAVEITTSWQGGTHFAWAFRQGWARLSDGTRALWAGTYPGSLEPWELHRHPGSRGPLTLTHTTKLPEGKGVRWWIFVCEPAEGWEEPVHGVEALKR